MKTHAVNNIKRISPCFWALLAAALLIVFSGTARADVILFWNFDGFSTEGETNYITDTVNSERLNLVNASIVEGKLSANGGYAQGTVEGTNGVTVTLPTGSANYTLSAFLSTTKNGAVGIIAWGTNSNYHCNSFRTDNDGLKSYWWGSDLSVKGYPEIISGFENHVVTTGIGTNHYLYVNGQLIGTNSTHVRDEVNQNFTVGNTVNNNTETLVGTIDNASVYNDAMEHTDIITIAGSRFNGLTNWWKAGQNIDMIAGVVRPDSITGTTVLNGANGDVMVFDRALEAGELAYYQGQLDASHAYVIDNMVGSEAGKTTWVRGTSANLSDAAQTPLGIYVGGTTDKPTLTATAQQLNAVNRTLVLGNGTLAVSSPSAFSLDLNRVDFDGGNVSIDASSNVTFNSNHLISVRNITSAAGSVLQFNGAGEIHVLGALSGTGNVVFSGDATTTLLSQSQGFTGTLTVQNGNTLVFTKQDTFNNAHNNSNVHVVADGGKITLTGAIYEYLSNVTLKNGAQIYAADGNTTWEAFKFRNLNVVRNSDDSAGAATTISGANNNHAVISFGPQSNQVGTTPATIYVEDITSASGSTDSVSDLVITAKIVNPTTVNTGVKTPGDIIKTGAGILELKNINSSYSGNLIINEGIVKVTAGSNDDNRTNSALGASNVAGRTVTINKNGTLQIAATDVMTDAHADSQLLFVVDGGKLVNTGAYYDFLQSITLKNGANMYAADGNANWEAFKIQNLRVERNSDGSAASAVTMTAANKDHAVFTFGSKTSTITTTPASIYVEDITSANASTPDNVEDLVISAKIVDPSVSGTAKRAAPIVKTGAGMLTLSNGGNTFTGDFTINEGTVKITPKRSGAYSALGEVKAGRTITVSSGAELILANQDIFTDAHNQNPLLFVMDGGTISNSGANYDYLTNLTFKNGGQLIATDGHATWKAFKLHNVSVERSDRADRSPATITATAGKANATIAFGDRSDVINVEDNKSVSTINVGEITSADGSADNLSDLIISAVIADPVYQTSGGLKKATQIIKAGEGTMEWTAANTITGKTTISAGTLRLSGAGTLGSGEVENNSILEFAYNSNVTCGNLISGTGDLVKTGTGTFALSNRNNNYTGDIYLNEGKIRINQQRSGSNSPLGAVKAGRTIYVNSGTEFILATQDVFTTAHEVEPVAFVVDGGKLSNEGAFYNNLTNVTLKNGAELYASDGNATWKAYKLHNLNIERSDRADRTPATITASDKANATIGFGYTTNAITGNTSVSTINVAEITSEDGSADDKSDLIISAIIGDPNYQTADALKHATQIVKAGAGTMEWTAANTITGKTTISEGTLRLSAAGTLGTGEVLVNEDGTLEFKNSTAAIPSAISGDGNILVSAGTATLTGAVTQTGGATTLANGTALNVASATLNNLAVTDESASAAVTASGNLTLNNGEDTKFVGSITAAAIEKTGNGTLKLNTGETGLITASNLTVSGGRLDLLGNAKGGITVGPNSVFSPGNSIGKAVVDGTFTLSSGTSSVLMEIGGSGPGENDLLIVSGDLALNNGKIYLELAEISSLNPGDEFVAVFSGNNSAALEDDFIANYVSAPDFMNLAYVRLVAGDYAGLYAITGEVFNASGVPEPSTWLLLLLGVFGLMYTRKRK